MSPNPQSLPEAHRAVRPLLLSALLLVAILSTPSVARTAEETGGEKGPETMQTERIEAGQPAPDFVLEDLEGDTHRLSEHDGPLVLVFFRGAW